MMAMALTKIAAVLAALSVALAAGSEIDARGQHCLQRGFDADGLDCRLCDRMASHLQSAVGDVDGDELQRKLAAVDRVVTDCKTCCTDLASIADLATQQQYDRVVLEVCTCKFGRYPKVANFVHHHAQHVPRLEIEYLNARHPHLIFYDADGTKREEISIASWDEETITEFVQAKLKPIVDSESPGDNENVAEAEAEAEAELVEATGEHESVDATDADDNETEEDDDVVEVEVSAEGD
ncbi:hypothetical protein P43SY_004551 [Pythium insidiosum]|uniref:Selenoprotein F n=1 Tax=Pythium insidiosum TaxID=114742 RepID=A0AAD5QBL8_PYTIN|nr:hypothetical protein P43SY_004551 [Pythium insidiosum]